LVALQNAIQKMVQIEQETEDELAYLLNELEEISEHARRERINRR
jgi:hypothetical protein